jgi:small subunit ribosomal protein S6
VREYELFFLLHPRLDEEGVTAAIERVTNSITTAGGEIVETKPWGRRRLAYPINNQWEGFYVLQQLRLPPNAVSALERNLSLSEDIMRHLVVRPGA